MLKRTRNVSVTVFIALVSTVVVMRAVITCVGPVAEQMMASLSMSYSTYGMLTGLPVVCVGLFCFLTPWLCSRMSANWAASLICALMCMGLTLRVLGSVPLLFLGTALMGASVAMLNALMPVLLRRFFPESVAAILSFYTAAINISSFLGASLSVPLSRVYGSYTLSLGFWLVFVLPAAVAWAVSGRRQRVAFNDTKEPSAFSFSLFAHLPLWSVILTMSLQGLSSYAFLAWLPPLFITEGFTELEAGNLLSLMLICSCLSCIFTSKAIVWCHGEKPLSILLVILGLVAMLLWTAGGVWAILGCVVMAVPNGLRFSLAIILTSKKAETLSQMLTLTSTAQGVGYTLAATGPFFCGLLYRGDADWTNVLVFLAFSFVAWGVAAYYGFGTCKVFPRVEACKGS